jgi:uncharacterized protein YjiS (DUF1127 family)
MSTNANITKQKVNAMAEFLVFRGVALDRAAPSIRTLIARTGTALAVWRQRRQLHALSAHMRRDIGLNDVQIMDETSRPFWDLPR